MVANKMSEQIARLSGRLLRSEAEQKRGSQGHALEWRRAKRGEGHRVGVENTVLKRQYLEEALGLFCWVTDLHTVFWRVVDNDADVTNLSGFKKIYK